MTGHEMKNAAYAALTAQGYLPASKTDRMAVVSIVVDAALADLRAKVEAMPPARGWFVKRQDVLDLIDGAE